MMRASLPFRASRLALALAALYVAAPAQAGEAELLKEMKRLSERLEKLEKQNAALEAQLQAKPAPVNEALAQRVQALEASNAKAEDALAKERLSENDPETITRLKDVEFRVLSMQKQARQIDKFDGITVGGNLTMVAQGANKPAVTPGTSNDQFNYRGDVAITLPGGSIGNADGKIYAQFRVGQGSGLSLANDYSSTPNTTAFALTNADDSSAILAQAWYQLDVPLPFGGHKPRSRENLTFNIGKMDPFLFFDQNVVADDETVQYLNNVFIHNPMLDSGGQAGVDAYGFTPGFRMAYHNETTRPEWWRASLGVFGSGPGASFENYSNLPFVIGQLEFGRKLDGQDGHYRLYAWTNGQAQPWQDASLQSQRQTGWGASVDQRVFGAATLWGRYGQQIDGDVKFDRALTLGVEFFGTPWERSGDGLGLAYGWLRTSQGYAAVAPDLYGYEANSNEQLAEIYYRWRVNEKVEITPDFQLVVNPGGNTSAPNTTVIGLRAKAMF